MTDEGETFLTHLERCEIQSSDLRVTGKDRAFGTVVEYLTEAGEWERLRHVRRVEVVIEVGELPRLSVEFVAESELVMC